MQRTQRTQRACGRAFAVASSMGVVSQGVRHGCGRQSWASCLHVHGRGRVYNYFDTASRDKAVLACNPSGTRARTHTHAHARAHTDVHVGRTSPEHGGRLICTEHDSCPVHSTASASTSNAAPHAEQALGAVLQHVLQICCPHTWQRPLSCPGLST